MNLTSLKKLAESASKGEWESDGNIVFCDGESVALDCPWRDASFIAALNPTTALRLIDIADASRAVLENLQLQHYWRDENTLRLDEALRGVEI